MSPAASHFVVAMARATTLLRFAAKSASSYARRNVPAYVNAQPTAIYARLAPKHPIHPAAFLKQTKRFISSARSTIGTALYHVEAAAYEQAYGHAPLRARYGSSKVAFAVSQSTGPSAFSSTLRPNLTGGAFPRTSGGYSLGGGKGGKRFFSHTPQPAAQVLQNVSQSMRAFLLQGKRAQYDGTDSNGRKRYKAVTPLQDKTIKRMRDVPKATPGAWVEFGVNPTITALSGLSSPLAGLAGYHSESASPQSVSGSEGVGLQTEGLLDVLQADFSRALKELAYVLADIKAVSALGDLPMSYSANTGRLRIHFPGTDMETVEKLATELGVQRGVIGQDEDFDAFVGTDIALMFPFASTSPVRSISAQPEVDSESEQLCGRTAYVVDAEAGSDSGSLISSFPDFRSDEPSDLSDESHLDYADLEALEDPWAPGTTRERLEALGSRSPTGSARTLSDLEFSLISGTNPRDLRREEYGNGISSPLEYSNDFEGLYRFIDMIDRRRG